MFRLKNWLINLGLLTGSSLVAILIVEGTLRLFNMSRYTFDDPGLQSFEAIRKTLYQADPELGYRIKPEAYPLWWEGTLNGRIYLDGYGKMLKEDHHDVLVLGDSLASDLILWEALSKGSFANKKVRYFVSGTPGYNTLQEAGLLEKHITMNVERILLEFCFNDFDKPMIIVKNDQDEKFKSIVVQPGAAKFPWLFKNSYFYQNITYFLDYQRANAKEDYEIVSEGLARISAYAKKKNAKLLVAIYPIMGPRPEDYDERRKYLAAKLKELEIPSVDLHEDLEKCDYAKIQLAPGDTLHPNLLGHSIAAKKILEEIGKDLQAELKFPKLASCN